MRISIGGVVLLAAYFVAGCGGGGGSETNRTDATYTVEGRVLNGVLTGSTVRALGAGGGSALEATTDSEGRYRIEVLQEELYRLRATGGELNAVEYGGTLEAFCPVGSDCFITPYTTVLLRLIDTHGFNQGDAKSLMANRLGFDADPFTEDVAVADFDLAAARAAIAGGHDLAGWVDSVVAWATDLGAAPPPGIRDTQPVMHTVSASAGPGGDIDPASRTVDHGAATTFTVSPAPGYSVTTISGCGGTLNGNMYTTSAITGNCLVVASFDLSMYTVIPGPIAGASWIEDSPTTVAHGSSVALTLVPDLGYDINKANITGCGGILGGTTYTTGPITGNCIITGSLDASAYTLSYAAGPNGSLSGTTSETVSHGQSGTGVVAVPDAGYRFVQWSDGVLTAARTDTNVTGNLSVTAGFEADSYTVTFDANGGSAPSPASIEVTHGQPYGALALVNRVGHEFLGWFTAVSAGTEVTAATTATITAPQTLYAQWKESEYTVTVGSITGGSLSPTSATVVHGNTAAFTLSADAGYDINDANLSGCGGSLDGNTYTTGAMTGDCKITGGLDLMVYTLSYAAGPNGTLEGETVQTVSHGSSGTEVTAVPDTGYSFVRWSDESTLNPRTDSNVTNDLGVTASFTLDEAPVGPTAVGSCGTTPQDMQYTNTLTATDIDPSSYPTFKLHDGSLGPLITPKGGEVIITDTTTGDFVYTPGLIRGLDTFQFKVTDTAGHASAAIETVVVDQAVMPLGDSITEGYISESENPPDSLRVGYREELQKMLKASGITFEFVGTVSHGWDVPNFDFNHQGHGGWTAAQIAWGPTGFPQDGVRAWLVQNPSDFILLHIGTNGLDPSNSTDVAAILDEIDRWRSNTFTEEVQVIVGLIIDRDPTDWRVSMFNDNVQTMVEARIAEGATLTLVDHQNALIYPDDLADKLHPNEIGYKKMAAVWFEKLAPLMDRCP